MSKLSKKIIFGIISLALIIVSIIEIKTASEDVIKLMPITSKTIIVDAGHGGIDPGS
ncbi:MAG TPA: N-acetylmuramoyl-L-alanine amidase, partial [Terrisporobacter glycolicus]|nr:N-acetylmuramoyl-L-alanine amidase [Terrisporobacter hibernicus]